MSTPKVRLVLVLLAALLAPSVSRAAGSASPAPVVSSEIQENAACAGQDTLAQILSGPAVQEPEDLSGSLFARPQEKASSCSASECAAFCNNICSPCGGYSVGQCTRGITGTCRSICSCYAC